MATFEEKIRTLDLKSTKWVDTRLYATIYTTSKKLEYNKSDFESGEIFTKMWNVKSYLIPGVGLT